MVNRRKTAKKSYLLCLCLSWIAHSPSTNSFQFKKTCILYWGDPKCLLKKQKTKPKNSRLACPSDEAHSISILPRRQTLLLSLFSSCWLVPRTKQCSTLFFNSHSLISSLANYRIISARQKGPHLFLQSRCMQGFDPETSTCSQLWAFLGATRA